MHSYVTAMRCARTLGQFDSLACAHARLHNRLTATAYTITFRSFLKIKSNENAENPKSKTNRVVRRHSRCEKNEAFFFHRLPCVLQRVVGQCIDFNVEITVPQPMLRHIKSGRKIKSCSPQPHLLSLSHFFFFRST